MEQKCPDIDTSSKNLEPEEKITNYQDLDLFSLEKEYEKTKKEFEEENESTKNSIFKKTKISNDNMTNSNIEMEYEKRHKPSLYETDEPLYKSYFGVIIAFIIIIVFIIIIIALILNHFSKTNLNNEKKDKVKILKDKPIYKNKIFQFISEMHNFTSKEISEIEVTNLTDQLYVDMCLQGILANKKKNNFKLSDSPKISIIKPVFNSTKYLNYSLRSIQNQNLTDIEIIIVDDASNDNNETINLVKKFQNEDPRIKLLTNENPKGLLYTICKGVLNSKGKYIMELDQDDLFTYATLFSELYDLAEKNNLDIISFWGIQEKNRYKIIKSDYENKKLGPILNDKLSLIKLSYRNKVKNFLELGMVWNKFVKREVFQNAVNKLGERFYGKYIFTHEDYIIIFMIYRQANRVKEYRRFGHLKFLHSESISSEKSLEKNKEQFFYDYLVYTDVVYELSTNYTMDKNFAALDFINRYKEMKHLVNSKNKELLLSIVKKYLNCKYIPLSEITKIKEIYYEILKK